MVFDRFQSRQTAIFPLGLGYIGGVFKAINKRCSKDLKAFKLSGV
jgi:hypothetical protein